MPNAMMGGDGGRLCLTLWWGGRRRETVPSAMVGEGGDGGRLCLTLWWGGETEGDCV